MLPQKVQRQGQRLPVLDCHIFLFAPRGMSFSLPILRKSNLLSSPLGWSPFVADFFVYHPKSSNRWLIFGMTLLGFMASKIFVEFIGIGS